MKRSLILASLLNLIFQAAFAFKVVSGNNVSINQPVWENLYIAGGSVSINAPVHGDVFIAGGRIVINDSIYNDILMAGGEITLNGYAGGDVRCAGGNIIIKKEIAGELIITGGTVNLEKNSSASALLAGGGNVTLDGTIRGRMKGRFGNLFINGTVGGEMEVKGEKLVVNGIVFGKATLAFRNIILEKQAGFAGDVRYWTSNDKIDFKNFVKNGNAVYDASLRLYSNEWYYLGAASLWGLFWYLAMAFLGILLLQYFFDTVMKKAALTFFDSTLRSLLVGFLFMVGVPVAALILIISLVGLPLGILLFILYFFTLVAATVISSVVLANWLNELNGYMWRYWRLATAALGFFIIFKFLFMTPFVGWIMMAVIVFISFGSILLNVNWKRKAGKLRQQK